MKMTAIITYVIYIRVYMIHSFIFLLIR